MAQVAGRRVGRARRWAAAAGVVTAVAAGGLGSLIVAQPAHAATAEADIETKIGNNTLQGKAGAKVSVGYQVTNHGKTDVGVTVTIQVPSNAEIESADRCTVGGNRRGASCQLPAMKAGASVNGSFQILLRTAGEGDGGVVARLNPNQKVNDPKPGNNNAGFKVRVTGAPSASASVKSPTAKASRSASTEPTETSTEEMLAPPEGNGAIPREDPKTPVSKDDGGMSFGFWIGVVAIIAALGLVGSLFYFRRKDRLEPDTGVFHLPTAGHDNPTSIITPGVYGTPAAPGPHGAPAYQGSQGPQGAQGFPGGQGFQGGQGFAGQGYPASPTAPGGSNVYGGPGAPPAGPPQGGPPPGPIPGANDQTILMRRPDDL